MPLRTSGGNVTALQEAQGLLLCVMDEPAAIHRDAVRLVQQAQAERIFRRSRNLCHHNRFKHTLRTVSMISTDSPRAANLTLEASEIARSSISLQPPPAGCRPDPCFDQASVKLEVRLRESRVLT